MAAAGAHPPILLLPLLLLLLPLLLLTVLHPPLKQPVNPQLPPSTSA
jgi:hypothetical protein